MKFYCKNKILDAAEQKKDAKPKRLHTLNLSSVVETLFFDFINIRHVYACNLKNCF